MEWPLWENGSLQAEDLVALRPTVGICVSGGNSGMAVLKAVANAKDLRSARAKATKNRAWEFLVDGCYLHMLRKPFFPQEETKPPTTIPWRIIMFPLKFVIWPWVQTSNTI